MSEESLQIAVSRYLKLQYPDVLFTAESSGIKLTMGQAVKAKKMRSGRGLPDLIIFEPRYGYHGLMLELKKEGTVIYKKDGSLRKNEHLAEQKAVIDKLISKKYYADFVIGFDDAKRVIDGYLK